MLSDHPDSVRQTAHAMPAYARRDATPAELPDELTAEEMLAGIREYRRAVSLETQEGRALQRMIVRGLVHLVVKNVAEAIRTGHRGRKPDDIESIYTQAYEVSPEEACARYGRPQRPVLFDLAHEIILECESRHVMRFMTERLSSIIAACDPQSVCEVGCGHGRNLFHLANRLPEVPCFGFDIAASAAATAAGIARMDLPNTELGRLYGIGSAGMPNIRAITFRHGSGFAVPTEDKVFDLVFTNEALEQMHAGRDQVLAELRRIARRYVVLREPFADCNSLLGRAFLWSNNFFRMRIEELKLHGLEPIRVWKSVPAKPTFAYGIVLCRPL